jgi:hypothetical protein
MVVSEQLHALVTFPLEKEPLVPIGKEAGWAPEPIWTLQSREISLAPARKKHWPSRQPISIKKITQKKATVRTHTHATMLTVIMPWHLKIQISLI